MPKPTPTFQPGSPGVKNASSLRAAERLAAEFEAGRFDSTLANHLLGDSKPFPRLLRACFLAERGQLERARIDIEVALAHARENPVVTLVAGSLLYATHDYQRALDLWAQVCARWPAQAAVPMHG